MRRTLLRAASWPYEAVDPVALTPALEEAVNVHRRRVGVEPLRRHPVLAAAALQHSHRMRNLRFFDHTDPYDRSSSHQRVEAIDRRCWRLVAENLAAGQWTAGQIVAAWVESPGHRANLEHPDVTHVGSAIVMGGSLHLYATQLYAAGRESEPFAIARRWLGCR